MDISLALTKATDGGLTDAEVLTIIQTSEGEKSDANKAVGHPLQHVQKTKIQRGRAYSEKRNWNEHLGRGSHSCFKTEGQQAQMVRNVLCSQDGIDALTRLNSGSLSAKITSKLGQGEDVIDQGFISELFGCFFNEKKATGIVVEIHLAQGNLHIRSAYPTA